MPGEQDLVERREQQPPTSCHAGPLQLVPQWGSGFQSSSPPALDDAQHLLRRLAAGAHDEDVAKLCLVAFIPLRQLLQGKEGWVAGAICLPAAVSEQGASQDEQLPCRKLHPPAALRRVPPLPPPARRGSARQRCRHTSCAAPRGLQSWGARQTPPASRSRVSAAGARGLEISSVDEVHQTGAAAAPAAAAHLLPPHLPRCADQRIQRTVGPPRCHCGRPGARSAALQQQGLSWGERGSHWGA